MVGKGAAVVALGGLISRVEPELIYTRPPGAMPEEEFLSLCLRCDICRKACPYGVIRPLLLTESIIAAGTPVLSGHCRRCWRCEPPCPTGALV